MDITQKQAEELAAHLIELEVEFIQNNMDEFIAGFYGWDEKFGDRSISLADTLTSDSKNEFNKQAVQEIVKLLIADFSCDYWKKNSDGGLYSSLMLDEYSGIISTALTNQLLMNSGVGIQMEIF